MTILPSDRVARQQLRTGLLYAGPSLVGFVLFTIFPLLASMVPWHRTGSGTVVYDPTANYLSGASRGVALQSSWEMLLLAVGSVLVSMAVGFGLALLLERPLRGITFYRAAVVLAALLPGVTLVLLWWKYFPWTNGPPRPSDGLGTALALSGVWVAGANMIVYLAALREVPHDLYDAAKAEGASFWQRTIYVTLPALGPVFGFTAMVGLFGGFLAFARPWAFASPVVSAYPGTYWVPYFLGSLHDFFGPTPALLRVGLLVIVVLAAIQGISQLRKFSAHRR